VVPHHNQQASEDRNPEQHGKELLLLNMLSLNLTR
jgi:hypothetical protein